MNNIYENQDQGFYQHCSMLTIKQLRIELGYKRPIDLTRELVERGVLERKKNESGYRLTKAAIENRLGQIWMKDIAHGGRVGHNMYYPDKIRDFLAKDRYLPIPPPKTQWVDVDGLPF